MEFIQNGQNKMKIEKIWKSIELTILTHSFLNKI